MLILSDHLKSKKPLQIQFLIEHLKIFSYVDRYLWALKSDRSQKLCETCLFVCWLVCVSLCLCVLVCVSLTAVPTSKSWKFWKLAKKSAGSKSPSKRKSIIFFLVLSLSLSLSIYLSLSHSSSQMVIYEY